MEEEKQIKLVDNSGDRRYFTIIPNYILNHSSGIDQALYLQMKRVAGENGKCFLTQETLCKKLKVSNDSLRISLKYLLENKWIEFVGTTPSKTRPVKTYKINDLWQLNAEYYSKKILAQTVVSTETQKDTAKVASMILAQTGTIKNPLNKNHKEVLRTASIDAELDKKVSSIINRFQDINPSYRTLFGQKTQRACAARLIQTHTLEKVEMYVDLAQKTKTILYAPMITTPFELETKLGALLSFAQKNKIQIGERSKLQELWDTIE